MDISQLKDRPAQPAINNTPVTNIRYRIESLRLQRDGLWFVLEQGTVISLVFCVYAIMLKIVIPKSAFRSPFFRPWSVHRSGKNAGLARRSANEYHPKPSQKHNDGEVESRIKKILAGRDLTGTWPVNQRS